MGDSKGFYMYTCGVPNVLVRAAQQQCELIQTSLLARAIDLPRVLFFCRWYDLLRFLSPLSDSHYSSYLPYSYSRLEVFLCNTQILVSKRQTGYWL